jgi:hypothetical protein
MCKPDPVFFIPGPVAAARGLTSLVGFLVKHWRVTGVLAGGVAVVAFVVLHAVIVGLAVTAFVVVMGRVVVLMRQPDWLTERPQAVSLVTVTTRQAAPALPRGLSITMRRRALPAPAKALPAAELTGRVVPAPVRKVVR